jgi:hypothetical protein
MKNTDWYLYSEVLNYIYVFKWAVASVIGVKLVQTGAKKLSVTVYISDFPHVLTILPVFDTRMREFDPLVYGKLWNFLKQFLIFKVRLGYSADQIHLT